MAFGFASFDQQEAIAIARAAALAQKQKAAAESVAKAIGATPAAGTPGTTEEVVSKPKRRGRRKKRREREHEERDEDESSGSSESYSLSSSEEEKEAVDRILQGQFSLKKKEEPKDPSAEPVDARKMAAALGLNLCRRGRRAPKPKAPPSDANLVALLPRPGEAWEPNFAGEGGRAPEAAVEAPPEWRRGLPSSAHRLGVPPLQRRMGVEARRQEPEEEGDGKDADGRGDWTHMAYGINHELWSGDAPMTRYRPVERRVPSEEWGLRKAATAGGRAGTLGSGASVAGRTTWHWEKEEEAEGPPAGWMRMPKAGASSAAAAASSKSPALEAPVEESRELEVEAEAAAPAEPSPALEGREEAPLELGDRVRVVGLKSRPEMNGLKGTLVAEKDDQRWQVVMDEDFCEKIFKAKNLERLPELDGAEDVD